MRLLNLVILIQTYDGLLLLKKLMFQKIQYIDRDYLFI